MLSNARFYRNVSVHHLHCLVELHRVGDPGALCHDAFEFNRGHLAVADLLAGLELVVLVADLVDV